MPYRSTILRNWNQTTNLADPRCQRFFQVLCLTGRHRGISLERVIRELAPCPRVWANSFGLSQWHCNPSIAGSGGASVASRGPAPQLRGFRPKDEGCASRRGCAATGNDLARIVKSPRPRTGGASGDMRAFGLSSASLPGFSGSRILIHGSVTRKASPASCSSLADWLV
jgi:hypothetical protein